MRLEGNNASGNFGGHLKISPFGGIADFQVQAQGWDNVQQDDVFGTWLWLCQSQAIGANIQTISVPDGTISISASTYRIKRHHQQKLSRRTLQQILLKQVL